MVDVDLLESLYRDIGPRVTKMIIEDVHAKGGTVSETMLITQGIVASLFLTYIKEESWDECLRFFMVGIINMLEEGERIPLEGFLNVAQKSKLN